MAFSGKTWMIAAVFGGTAAGVLSYGPADDGKQWLSDFLLGIGTTCLLFVPLYFVGKRLDRHIEDMRGVTVAAIDTVREETTSQVASLSERVTTVEEDVDRRLEDIAGTVSERLQHEQRRDAEAFRALRETPSRSAVVSAIQRALNLRILSRDHAPRVQVSDAQALFLNIFCPSEIEQENYLGKEVEAQLVSRAGRVLAGFAWEPDQSTDDFLFEVGRRFAAHESDQPFDPLMFFTGLSDLLLVGLSASERRPIIELCPPQWAVVEHAIVTYGEAVPLVDATAAEFNRTPDLFAHLHSKTWIDAGSLDRAHASLTALFGDDGSDDEPPF